MSAQDMAKAGAAGEAPIYDLQAASRVPN